MLDKDKKTKVVNILVQALLSLLTALCGVFTGCQVAH